MHLRTFALLAVLGLTAALAPRPTLADGAWLDRALVNWNYEGMDLPKPDYGAYMIDDFCRRDRTPVTNEEWAVWVSGWEVDATMNHGNGVVTLLGFTGTDGMCRALNYNVFVFVNGVFAGTISPEPMDARSDGVGYVSSVSADGTQLTGEFARYTDSDALCCPSRTTTVTYAIQRGARGPLLVPQTAVTVATRPG